MPLPDPPGLPVEQLRWRCDPLLVTGAAAGDELDRHGQRRALEALRLGLEIDAPGYHVFVSGVSGTGRLQSVRRELDGLADRCVIVTDKAFVHGFDDPLRPRLLELPGGRMRPFATRMAQLATELIARLDALSEDESHLKRRRRLESALIEARTRQMEELTAAARRAGLALYEVKEHGFSRPALGVADGDEILPIELLRLFAEQGRMAVEKAEELEAAARPLQARVERTTIELRRAARARARELAAFDREQARAALKPELDEVAGEFPFDGVRRHLGQVEQWILDQLAHARGERFARRLRRRLAINVILDQTARKQTPIIVESHPTLANLFGSIDVRTTSAGAPIADHRGIRAGSLVQADGGYLVMKAADVIAEEGVWAALRRALKQERVAIAAPESSAALKPEAIPLKVKVVLIGELAHENLLEQHDPEFREIFKVRAEFDSEVDRTPENLARLAALMRRLGAEERLLPFTNEALALLAEEAVRRAGHGAKLTARIAPLADLAREANLFAQRDGASTLDRSHLRLAHAAAREREDLHERKLFDQIRDGTLLLTTSGERVGQVNALTVVSAGEFDFGRPARITATVAAGDLGLLNIEREVQLSGDIHDKGVFILGALLRERFGQSYPLSLAASLCFEQSYGPIDGDSAAVAEWLALISALSWVPLKQGLAVTGSINQKGDVQPVGAVNEKIEGFFDVCALHGLDGSQGVVIPRRNVPDLMLEERVVEAVAAGKFRLFTVDTIDEVVEIVTGVAAGTLGGDGHWPKDSVNGRCADHLWFLSEAARDAKGGGGDPAPTTSGGHGNVSGAGTTDPASPALPTPAPTPAATEPLPALPALPAQEPVPAPQP